MRLLKMHKGRFPGTSLLRLLPFLGWGFPLVGQDYLEILSAWYCSFGKCCETGDCRIINNITGRGCAACVACFEGFFLLKCILESDVSKGLF